MRGYTVRMNTISRIDSFHMIKRYYCFMITRPSTPADMSQETMELFGQHTSREWEVLLRPSAAGAITTRSPKACISAKVRSVRI